MLVNVTAPEVEVEAAILMSVTSAGPVRGKRGVLYNVVHEGSEPLSADAVRADVFQPGGKQAASPPLQPLLPCSASSPAAPPPAPTRVKEPAGGRSLVQMEPRSK